MKEATITPSSTESPSSGSSSASGKLIMKTGMTFDFQIHDVDPQGYFAYSTKIAGALLDWYWDFSTSTMIKNESTGLDEEYIVVKAGVTSIGPMSFLYKLLLKSQIEKAYDEINVNFKKMCEERK